MTNACNHIRQYLGAGHVLACADPWCGRVAGRDLVVMVYNGPFLEKRTYRRVLDGASWGWDLAAIERRSAEEVQRESLARILRQISEAP